MEGDLVKRLTRFGLSVNQAKVYLSIAQSASASVNTISKTTHIYRQDIYKILPKLEKMGLITKTIERPLTIAAIPVEEALNFIISIEQQKASERIKSLKADLKALSNAIEENRIAVGTTTLEQTEAVFLSTDRVIKNKLYVSYQNARTKCDLIMDFELLVRWLPFLRKCFQAIAINKVETRLLIDTDKKSDLVKITLKKILPSTGNFIVKYTAGKITVRSYIIIDYKEAYIFTQKKTLLFSPCPLCTNCINVISVYKEDFEKQWNKSQLVIIHAKGDATE
jgi:sugar-specific transcriptional regulator TrmB